MDQQSRSTNQHKENPSIDQPDHKQQNIKTQWTRHWMDKQLQISRIDDLIQQDRYKSSKKSSMESLLQDENHLEIDNNTNSSQNQYL